MEGMELEEGFQYKCRAGYLIGQRSPRDDLHSE
jgi:hypothetical protein